MVSCPGLGAHSALRFVDDSPLEEGVSSEPVSELGYPAAAGIRRDSEGFMDG
jgi:hypothetical protein